MAHTLKLHLKAPKQRRLGRRGLLLALTAALILAAALTAYKGAGSTPSITSYDELKARIASQQRVAVMFASPTCHVCEKMMPHWLRLARASEQLHTSFYVVQLGPATAEAFREYHVSETPTFILFVNGRPIAVHVGGFQGENVTQSMLQWILSPLSATPPLAGGNESYTCSGDSCRVPLHEEGAGPGLAAAAFAAALAAGVLASLSPCTLPLLVAHASASRGGRSRRAAAGCFAASLAAVTAVGLVLAASSWAASGLSGALTPLLAALLLVAGVVELAGFSVELPGVRLGRLGLYGRCGLFGFLSVQCNLPLVAAPFLMVAGLGLSDAGAAVSAALGYGVGLSAVLALVAAGTPGVASAVGRLLGRGELVEKASGLLLIASGALLAVYYLGLV